MSEKLTVEQVEHLNKYQKNGLFHPLTCGALTYECKTVLEAKKDGWICPTCNYWQGFGTLEPMILKLNLDLTPEEMLKSAFSQMD